MMGEKKTDFFKYGLSVEDRKMKYHKRVFEVNVLSVKAYFFTW